MALVDADYIFILADISGAGAASDTQIYNASELREFAESGRSRKSCTKSSSKRHKGYALLFHRQRCLRSVIFNDEALLPARSQR